MLGWYDFGPTFAEKQKMKAEIIPIKEKPMSVVGEKIIERIWDLIVKRDAAKGGKETAKVNALINKELRRLHNAQE